MTLKELEKHLWDTATYLRGTIDAGDYKQYIFPLLFFKRICDVYDEEYDMALEESDGNTEYAQFEENHRFLVPQGFHWNDVRDVTSNVGEKIQSSMREIEKSNKKTLDGIFGDASWTNKDRLSDEILVNLIEHFSRHNLNNSNINEDQLGTAYEYLIKKFANDSGHTAAEFYTNRTVVKLMTLIVDPKPGESIYDPTCGSGGLLLNCALKLKEDNKEYRSLGLYGQEINHITSSISRMNLYLHGIENFEIYRGDTLSNPGFLENDKLKKFNIVLANPPYSLKSWNQKSFENDRYGRNIWGTPPAGCGDYAFQQHIQKSLKIENGRSCVLWPYGVLFRDSERDMRKKMIEEDLVECVIALGKNLFYNSIMESCLLITNNNKKEERRGKVLFIDARKELKREKTISYLMPEHISKIYAAYKNFISEEHFTYIAEINEIINKEASLNIPLYIKSDNQEIILEPSEAYSKWIKSSDDLKESMNDLFNKV